MIGEVMEERTCIWVLCWLIWCQQLKRWGQFVPLFDELSVKYFLSHKLCFPEKNKTKQLLSRSKVWWKVVINYSLVSGCGCTYSCLRACIFIFFCVWWFCCHVKVWFIEIQQCSWLPQAADCISTQTWGKERNCVHLKKKTTTLLYFPHPFCLLGSNWVLQIYTGMYVCVLFLSLNSIIS